MSTAVKINDFALKIGALCAFALFVFILCSGITLADGSSDPDSLSVNPNVLSPPIIPNFIDFSSFDLYFDYIDKIYISDNTVTIESNIMTHINPTWSVTFTPTSSGSNNLKPASAIEFRQLNASVIQFELSSDPGFYTISLKNIQNLAIQNSQSDGLVRRVILTAVPQNSVSEDDALVIYPSIIYASIDSYPIYSFDYSQYFSDGTFYPDLLDNIAGKNMIYLFSGKNLRSFYWYSSNDSDNIDYMPVSEFSKINSVKAYKPTFYIKPLSGSDFSLNQVFICPEHDFYYIGSNQIHVSECESNIQWKISINGKESDASSLLKPDSFDASHPHFISLNDLNLLENRFLNSRNELIESIDLKIYPKISETSDYKSTALPFIFDIRPGVIEDIVQIPIRASPLSDSISVSVSETSPNSNKPSLSVLSFPSELSSILENSVVIIKTLNADALSDVFEQSPESEVFAVIDIDFSENKAELNQFLSSTGQTVTLTFTIPKTVAGNEINPKELKIYHIVEANGEKKLEQLKIEVSESEINGIPYYVISAETSGFSSFAVVSEPLEIETPVLPVSASSAPISYTQNNTALSSNESDFSNNTNSSSPRPLFPTLPSLIEIVSGYFSMFSVLVVLFSGLFMWIYIRREL